MHILNMNILCEQPATTLSGRRYCVGYLQSDCYGSQRIFMKRNIDALIGWSVDEQEKISST